MKNPICNYLGACLLALTLIQPFASAADAPIPGELNPPEGNELFMKAQASGTQNYICMPSDAGVKWTFLGPQATLSVTIKLGSRDMSLQMATHYLSPNPNENNTPRATWQSSIDSSAVWGRAIVTVTDTAVVAPGAIPWLLLQAVGVRQGPGGGSMLSQTTYVQRLNTSGGIAPVTGCSANEDIGHTAFVPYSTDYYFFKASHRGF